MRKRTKARECALQVLYQVDLTHEDPAAVLETFWSEYPADDESVAQYATMLVTGTREHLGAIDKLITQCADNWALARMAVVDRNILRLGTYELLFVAEVPPKVTMNEAVELAKKFGDVDSSKFVNGILDNIHKTEPRRVAAAPDAARPSAGADTP